MADNNLQVTAVYASGDTVVKKTAITNDVTSFKVTELEGPFDDNGNLLQYVEEGQMCVYIATLDKDVSTVNIKEVNWAMAYDENGDGDFKFEKIQGGRRYDKNRIWVYLQSKFATSLLTIHAYTSTIPANGDSVTVSVDHAQYEAGLESGDRCNTPSNTTIVTNATTEVEDKEFELEVGIRLHFLRYGFFEGDDHADHNAIGKKSEIHNNKSELKPYKKYSDVKNFHCHLTELVFGGYIYVIDPKKTTLKDSFEYYITPNQKLRHIPWYTDPKSEDKRTVFGARKAGKKITEHHYHLVEFIKDKEETPEVYICYSPVQWSKAYFEKMLSNDQGMRDERMVKVTCEGFPQGVTENVDEQYAFDGFSAAFTEGNQIGSNRLKSKKKHLANSQAKKTGEDAELKPDMFIPLLDPINSAREIANEVAHSMLNFKALVEAIQTGETQEKAFNRICTGNDAPPPDKEYYALYSLALTSYHMVYNDKKSIEKYDGGVTAPNNLWGELHEGEEYKESKEWHGNSAGTKNNVKFFGYDGADPEKIKGILGVPQRKKLRKKVNEFRNDLGVFLSHDDFKIPSDDYLYNIKERTLEGREVLFDLLDVLFTTTYDFDRHLLLKEDYIKEDAWQDKILEITNQDNASNYKGGAKASKAPDYEGIDPLYALVTPLLNIDKVISKGDKTAIKIAKVLKKKFKFEAKRYYKTLKKSGSNYYTNFDQFAKVTIKKCNQNINAYGLNMLEVSSIEEEKVLAKLFKEKGVVPNTDEIEKGPYRGKKPINRYVKSKKLTVVKVKNAQYVLQIPVQEPADAKKATQQLKFSKIVNSPAFSGLILGLDAYNLGGAFMQLKKDPSLKNKTNTLKQAISVTESGLTLWKVTTTSARVSEKLSGNLIPILSVASGTLTASICMWDAYESFDKSDDDAGTMFALAGVAFGVAAYASLGTIYTSLALAGPVGWIAAIVGTGFLVLAYMFTDTPLETYFKNYLLSDHYSKGFPLLADESPMAYNNRVYKNRALFTDDAYEDTLMLPSEAEAKLLDLIVCPSVVVKREKRDYYTGRRKGFPKYEITGVTAQLMFAKFLNNISQLEVKAYLCYNGLNDIRNTPPDVAIYKEMRVDKNGHPFVNVSATLTAHQKEFILDESEIFFTVRLAISKKLYFPYPRKGKDYYLSFRSQSLAGGKNGIFSTFEEAFVEIQEAKFLPFSELKSRKTW